ncbi:ribonuclease H2 subunit C [Coccidioides immitis RS]|uniref:Ribonuclease H2 subunit C n=4 Tax=Coccidioides immitis TaxID=5501 RepID=J3KHP0_COCIM|nr:ribonuclease H2 subunit C [Coccidioides immitis RS]EAS35405.3 ribonuclease H2 subunit C [Coccidioides immitis RS]KMP00647.1 hypothetical protein CIRG_00789 [Coccidioides immitis RMSCC 2394]KMU85310.1 hypothetical protein CIHG_03094 [Coccidioides immitis H538.4]TPX26328.1 hypothetical protein DIZ76_011790 [Coccidioides immitis]
MFVLRPSGESKTPLPAAQPNILPCKIHHDGPTEVSQRHWSPITDADNPELATTYFRGRKLRGRRIALPEGYHGVVASPTEMTLKQPKKDTSRGSSRPDNPECNRNTNNDSDNDGNDVDEDDDDVQPSPTILEAQGTFSNLIVWDHDKVPSTDDVFVKGIGEWIRFAEAMHSDMNPIDSEKTS